MDTPALVGRVRERLAARLSLAAKTAWIGWGLSASLLMVSGAQAHAWMPLFTGASLLAAAGAFAMLASWVMTLRTGLAPGHVSVRGGRLRLVRGGRSVVIPVEEITSAHAQAWGRADVSTADDTWVLDLQDDADAARLVEALGFAPGGRSVTYRLAQPARRFVHVAIAFGAYQLANVLTAAVTVLATSLLREAPGARVLPMMMFATITALIAALFAVGKRVVRAPIVTVGADGVRVESFGFRRRFVPLERLVAARQTALGGQVHLELDDGRMVHVGGLVIDSAKRDAAAAHVRALLARRAGARVDAPALAREGRSVADWRAHVRRVVEGGGYRVAAANDSLSDVLGAPGVPLEQRVGAALALRVAAPAEGLRQIRVAADACADPKARAALEAAAADELDERALDAALK